MHHVMEWRRGLPCARHWQEFLMTEEIMADILAGTLNLGLMGTFLKKLLSPRFRNEVMNMPLAGIEAIFSSTDLHVKK
uniref:Uncharacterized protein n=1 Tax=Aegilops tauschii subsp. strangulata TaxID=200361 RepID=A0A453FJ98_AEGTS